jgi:hypothetical protein
MVKLFLILIVKRSNDKPLGIPAIPVFSSRDRFDSLTCLHIGFSLTYKKKPSAGAERNLINPVKTIWLW